VGVVCLIDKGAVGFNEFLYRRPEAAGKGGKDGFVNDPLLGGVIGIVINRDQVIEGFDQFGFRLGGVEVGRCRRYGLRFLRFILLSFEWSWLCLALRLARTAFAGEGSNKTGFRLCAIIKADRKPRSDKN